MNGCRHRLPVWLAMLVVGVAVVSIAGAARADTDAFEAVRIQPYVENPFYWQYRGEPLLLVGGTHDDNPFNNPSHDPVAGEERLEDHLDLLVSAGGNYVRNTMSHRDIMNVYPYLREEGSFRDAMDDASLWNSVDGVHGVHVARSLEGAGAISVWSNGDPVPEFRIRREMELTDVAHGVVEVWFHVRDASVADRLDRVAVTLETADGATTLQWPGTILAGWHVVILHVDEFESAGLDPSDVEAVELALVLEEDATLAEGDVLWDELVIAGRFDLDSFNPTYWERLRAFLQMAVERDVIVQLELWDKVELFDDGSSISHKWDPRRGWSNHPFNPRNNVNYTVQSSGLPDTVDWSYHPRGDAPRGDMSTEILHPFFYTPPTVADLLPGGDREIADFGLTQEAHAKLVKTVLPYQEAFVDEVLEVALDFPNVIYTINNETYLPTPDWSDHWARRIHEAASARGVSAEVGDMRGEGALESAPAHAHRYVLNHPARYTFIDVSQNNEPKSGDAQWSELQWVRDAMRGIENGIRPITNVKIYDFTSSSADASRLDASVERFWRNIFGGASSARFHRRMGAALHRPMDGDGTPITDESNEIGLASFRSAGMFVREFDLFAARPDTSVLGDRDSHEAYAMVGPEDTFAVYIPAGGAVRLDVPAGRYQIRWLDVSASEWLETTEVDAAGSLMLRPPVERRALVTVSPAGP